MWRLQWQLYVLELKYCVSNVKKTSKQCKRYKTKHRYLTDNYRIIHSKKTLIGVFEPLFECGHYNCNYNFFNEFETSVFLRINFAWKSFYRLKAYTMLPFLEKKSVYLNIISNPENLICRDCLKIKLKQFWDVLYIIILAVSRIFIGTSDPINIQVFSL